MPTDSPHVYRRIGLQRGVSDDVLRAAANQMWRVQQHGLIPVLTLKHLAVQTGASHRYLRSIVERARDPYTEFAKPKGRLGDMRGISAPHPALMSVQRWMLENIFSRILPHPASFAYQSGRSAAICAEQHLQARWILKFDLHSFFHSITEHSAYRILVDNGYNGLIAFEMARLCTRYGRHGTESLGTAYRSNIGDERYLTIRAYRNRSIGYLPQGAPTSGAIANLASRSLDETLSSVAERYHLVYTRYADDMIFSTSESFSRELADRCARDVRAAVAKNKFVLHERKTRIIPPGARKIVLGLLVDGERLRLPRDSRSRLEAHVRGVECFGLAEHVRHWEYASVMGLVRHVTGLLSYARGIETGWAQDLSRRWESVLSNQGVDLLEVERWS
jgi:RNA-directed DNA polymerase